MIDFEGISTLDDLKRRYHALCKELHPDVGGSEEAMKALNAEYAQTLKRLMNDERGNESEYSAEAEASELLYRDKIAAVAHLEGLELEIIGTWLWVMGNTYAHRETLKSAGFSFAPVKKVWFYRASEYRTRTRGEAHDMEDIRSKYGATKIVKEQGSPSGTASRTLQ